MHFQLYKYTILILNRGHLFKCPCFSSDIMAVIGFVEPSYRVVEGEGNVIVEVELISGNIPAGNEVEITLTTDAGTATGSEVEHYMYMYSYNVHVHVRVSSPIR